MATARRDPNRLSSMKRRSSFMRLLMCCLARPFDCHCSSQCELRLLPALHSPREDMSRQDTVLGVSWRLMSSAQGAEDASLSGVEASESRSDSRVSCAGDPAKWQWRAGGDTTRTSGSALPARVGCFLVGELLLAVPLLLRREAHAILALKILA